MARQVCKFIVVVVTIVSALLIVPAEGTRRPQRRSDLENVPPVSLSGYVVPLQGSETCRTNGICTNTLPAPAADKTLKHLALARGTLTYSCADRKPTETPLYESQETSLWDAAPLIPNIANEQIFHTIVPQLYEFDYTKLANSTLVCIGLITTEYGAAVVDLFDVEAFGTNLQQEVKAPVLPTLNLQWAWETSNDLAWDVYRVKTVAGQAPETCAGQKNVIELDYAAEYWFYHR